MGEQTDMRKNKTLKIVVAMLFYCFFVLTLAFYTLWFFNGSTLLLLPMAISGFLYLWSVLIYGSGVRI